MSDARIQRWAEVLVQYSVAVQPGQVVAIQGGIDAEVLLRAVYREVLKAGGIPQMLPILPGLQRDLYQIANDDQLTTIAPIERFMRTEADVTIQIMAERNTRALTGIDPTRQSVAMRARADLFKTFLSRAADGSLKWTLTLFPTDAYAQDAGLSSEEYTEFVYEACKLNSPDPVAAWREIGKKQQVLTDWLN
ncbi:MAG: aminopeptidase, partial [Thermomicrobiales bacterium]